MGNVIELDRYKGMKRREYLKRYDAQLQKFVNAFLAQNLGVSYETLSYQYITSQQVAQSAAWDYVDFRDTLRDGFYEAFGPELLRLCQETQYWFDERFITADELVDRCVSQIILGPDLSAAR